MYYWKSLLHHRVVINEQIMNKQYRKWQKLDSRLVRHYTFSPWRCIFWFGPSLIVLAKWPKGHVIGEWKGVFSKGVKRGVGLPSPPFPCSAACHKVWQAVSRPNDNVFLPIIPYLGHRSDWLWRHDLLLGNGAERISQKLSALRRAAISVKKSARELVQFRGVLRREIRQHAADDDSGN